MNRFTAAGVVVAMAALVIAPAGAQKGDQAQTLFEAARQTETLEGDLAKAIKQYQAIVDAYVKTDRSVAAQALVRMAESYQKLGDAEAQTIYRRIVREFSDRQEEVALARARLDGGDAAAPVAGERAVLKGPNVDGWGTVSSDGRFMSYVDLATRNVVLRDLKAGTDRALTNGRRAAIARDADPLTALSRDGKQVAFEWATPDTGEIELRIVNVQGSGVPEARRLLALRLDDVLAISPFDWSPDGKWLAVSVQRTDLVGQLSMVSVQDGSLRVLKSIGWSGPHRVFFSPDGRYIAYSVSADDSLDESRVFVMAVDGSRESAVVEHPSRNIIMGWSPDGASLLFASDRSGSFGLWSIPISDGQSRGAATLLKTNIGSSWSLGVTASGTLYVWKQTIARYLQVSPIDVRMGTPPTARADSFQSFLGGGGNPVWSPDGKYLAYNSGPTDENFECCSTFTIRSTDGSLVRKLPRRLAYLQRFSWSVDGRALIGPGRDLKGRWGTYRVDVQTGEPTRVGDGDLLWASETPATRTMAANTTMDGTKLYYGPGQGTPLAYPTGLGGGILERDLSSGTDRVIFQDTAPGVGLWLSPDAQHIAFGRNLSGAVSFNNNDRGAIGANALHVMPAGGGLPKELVRGFRRVLWTSDSRALLVLKAPPEPQELWLVPIDGGAPRKLGIAVHDSSGQIPFSLRPDGRQIAFVAGNSAPSWSEIWALESFLPSAQARR